MRRSFGWKDLESEKVELDGLRVCVLRMGKNEIKFISKVVNIIYNLAGKWRIASDLDQKSTAKHVEE